MLKPELLSPAGSFSSLKAAVTCGCDAVYIGGKNFSARNYASNFDLTDIDLAVDYCHLRGVKLYVAVNTLVKENELLDFLCYVESCFNYGVDAFIVQDIGAALMLKKYLPHIVLHASTQMTVHTLEAVKFLEDNGFNRVVVARELSLNDINYICSKSNMEIECFIHGALCVCYSGQCLMSSAVGERSANRGRCAQPCRLKYRFYNGKEGHLLSPCDLSAISFLPDIISAGVSSLKIEGRMKSNEYVAGATYIYRKYIDLFFSNPDNFFVDDADIKNLMQLFNRGGFSKGSFFGLPDENSISIKKPKNWGVYLGQVSAIKDNIVSFKTNEDIVAGDGIEIWDDNGNSCGLYVNKNYRKGDLVTVLADAFIGSFVYKTFNKVLFDTLNNYKDNRKIIINGRFTAKLGCNCSLELFYNNLSVTAYGNVVVLAKNNPLSCDVINKQLRKTGSTTFLLKDIEIYIDKDCFLSIADLNLLRRSACEMLSNCIIDGYKNNSNIGKINLRNNTQTVKLIKKISVLVQNKNQFLETVKSKFVSRVYFEFNDDFIKNYDTFIECCSKNGIELFLALPYVNCDTFDRLDIDVTGFLVRTYGQFEYLSKYNKKIIIDRTLNCFNSESIDFWFNKGAYSVTLSTELDLFEINGSAVNDCELVCFGHLHNMVTIYCPFRLYGECNNISDSESYFFSDRKGNKFNVLPNCKFCYCLILNCNAVFILNQYYDFKNTVPEFIRLEFTNEAPPLINAVINSYGNVFCANGNLYDESISKVCGYFSRNGFTKAHFYKTVE